MKLLSLLSPILVLLLSVVSLHFLHSNCNQLSLFLQPTMPLFGFREIERNIRANDFNCLTFFSIFNWRVFLFLLYCPRARRSVVQFWSWVFCRLVESEMVAVVAIVSGCGFGGEECLDIHERCCPPVRWFHGG